MKNARGFTLIEMVVVMVILGILAAVALPKFVDMTTQARQAKMNGAVGAVQSSITLIHAKWLAQGSPTTGNIAIEGATLVIGTDVSTTGYPLAVAYQNGATDKNIAGLDSSYTVTVAATVATVKDTSRNTCSFTVTNSTGAGTPPALDSSALTGSTAGVSNC